jgi:hypothetical protein
MGNPSRWLPLGIAVLHGKVSRMLAQLAALVNNKVALAVVAEHLAKYF